MKQFTCIVALLFVLQYSFAQIDSGIINDINRFQQELINEYKDAKASPLKPAEREKFGGVKFFVLDTQYMVTAKFIKTPGEKIFEMPSSGKEKKLYVKYAEAQFSLHGKPYKLNIYQNIDLAKDRNYRDYLFIPFRDATSGKETYGGGRYIDLRIPYGDKIIINFNKAYQPYCAYTEGYNCPIPPRENYLPVKIEAGVRF